MSAHPQQRFGAHMSVAGGLEHAFQGGVKAGCDCLQLFVKNQRQWSAAPLSEAQIAAYRLAERETKLGPVVAHATYLLNLGSPDEALRQKSCSALSDELVRCHALGVSGLVLHPGAHLGSGLDRGIEWIASSLETVLKATSSTATSILLETTAGQGSSIGHQLEHLGRILKHLGRPPRVGICLDTCHLFAAGYNLGDEGGYVRMMEEMSQHSLIERVRCIHVNDSKRECGSKVDRHEHIGKGCIGKAGFARILNDPSFHGVPRILETPKGQDTRGRDFDRINLAALRRLVIA